MKPKPICHLLFAVLASNAFIAASHAQSIADIARKEREKKQQQAKTGSTPVVYNNDNIGSSRSSHTASATPTASPTASPAAENGPKKASAGQWTAKIRQQKQVVNTLQEQVTGLQQSIRYVEANAYTNGVQYNEAQRKKQEEVEKLQQRLADEKQKLSEMQEGARKDGYGNSVYDPN